MEKKRKIRDAKYKGMIKKDRSEPFDLQWIRRKKKKTKQDIRRLKDFDARKAKLLPDDTNCKVCDRPIPSPMWFCSSKCKEKYDAKKSSKKIKRKIKKKKS